MKIQQHLDNDWRTELYAEMVKQVAERQALLEEIRTKLPDVYETYLKIRAMFYLTYPWPRKV